VFRVRFDRTVDTCLCLSSVVVSIVRTDRETSRRGYTCLVNIDDRRPYGQLSVDPCRSLSSYLISIGKICRRHSLSNAVHFSRENIKRLDKRIIRLVRPSSATRMTCRTVTRTRQVPIDVVESIELRRCPTESIDSTGMHDETITAHTRSATTDPIRMQGERRHVLVRRE
jgi:hypothetical protein